MSAKDTSVKLSKSSSNATTISIILNPASVARILGTAAFILILASTGGLITADIPGNQNLYWLVRLFDVDREQNIPTFFSVFLLLSATLLLTIISLLERRRKSVDNFYWVVLSFGFLFMALDELASLHEKLGKPVNNLFGNRDLGAFSYGWVIPLIALVALLALFFWRFLMHLPFNTRRTFFIAAIIYIGGALGCELIEGYYRALYGTLIYSAFTTIEESMEMAGVILFIWGLLVYIANTYGEVSFQINSSHDRKYGRSA
jgi:hypothetical protein